MTKNSSRYQIRLVGTTPLVMHSNRLVNPLDPFKKQLASITGKRLKTDADHLAISRLEFQAGLYIDDDGPYIPAGNIRKMLIEGARKSKNGKAFESGLFVEQNATLEYDGPRDLEGLMNGGFERFAWSTVVGNQRNSIIRTRPRFPDWACETTLTVEPTLIDFQSLQLALEHAQLVGICDARSVGFGRFCGSVEAI